MKPSISLSKRPQPGDYGAFYQRYVDLSTQADVVASLQAQAEHTPAFFRSLPADKWAYRYAPGKWTVADILLHLIDTERVFTYRALRIARGDNTPLPGFNQDFFVQHGGANRRSAETLIGEYTAVRAGTIHLFQSLEEAAWERRGTASEHPITVLALAHLTVGHERHHLGVIRERYG